MPPKATKDSIVSGLCVPNFSLYGLFGLLKKLEETNLQPHSVEILRARFISVLKSEVVKIHFWLASCVTVLDFQFCPDVYSFAVRYATKNAATLVAIRERTERIFHDDAELEEAMSMPLDFWVQKLSNPKAFSKNRVDIETFGQSMFFAPTRLIHVWLAEERWSFTVATPSLPNCPVVAVSMGFEELTGYNRNEILGKNCRFLQNGCPPPCWEDRQGLRNVCRNDMTPDSFVARLMNSRSPRCGGKKFENLVVLVKIVIQGKIFVCGLQTDSGCLKGREQCSEAQIANVVEQFLDNLYMGYLHRFKDQFMKAYNLPGFEDPAPIPFDRQARESFTSLLSTFPLTCGPSVPEWFRSPQALAPSVQISPVPSVASVASGEREDEHPDFRVGHPAHCVPCKFNSYSLDGCKRDNCPYCHIYHVSNRKRTKNGKTRR